MFDLHKLNFTKYWWTVYKIFPSNDLTEWCCSKLAHFNKKFVGFIFILFCYKYIVTALDAVYE